MRRAPATVLLLSIPAAIAQPGTAADHQGFSHDSVRSNGVPGVTCSPNRK